MLPALRSRPRRVTANLGAGYNRAVIGARRVYRSAMMTVARRPSHCKDCGMALANAATDIRSVGSTTWSTTNCGRANSANL